MTQPYQLTNSTTILRKSDGAQIPADASNADYNFYQAWVAQGNTADPAPVITQLAQPTLTELQTQLAALSAQIAAATNAS